MRIALLALVVACGPRAMQPTSYRVEAPGVLALDVDVPVRDRHAHGVDSVAVGEYDLGTCWMDFDAGQYANRLVPGSLELPDDYRSRVAPIDGRSARWATFTAKGDHPGFAAGVYMPQLKVEIVCPTAAERERALGWFATMRVTWRAKDDEPIVGPASWEAPPACVTARVPASTSALRVENVYAFRTDDTPHLIELDHTAAEVPLAPGDYTVYLTMHTPGDPEIRCEHVSIGENQMTIVRAPGAAPIAVAQVLTAREIYVSIETYRRSYRLVRTGERAELDLVIEKGTAKHLDGSEKNEAAWTPEQTKHYEGTARDVKGGVELELRYKGAYATEQLAWRCEQRSFELHPANARPVHVGPVSNAQVGCLGARSVWKPAQTAPAMALMCGPPKIPMGYADIAFLPAATAIDTVSEWIDCHIQVHAFRMR